MRYNNRYGLALQQISIRQRRSMERNASGDYRGVPYGGVKEQGPCVYANELAKRGLVVLTFDQSFMGVRRGAEESFVAGNLYENFSAAVDYNESKSHMWTVIKSG